MQISHMTGWHVRNGRERKFLATIISPSSGLYRAIIESLKAEAVNRTPASPPRRLTLSRFKRRTAAANVAARMCENVCACVGRKGDERDLHSKREFCMRQVRPGKYCKNNLPRARKVVSRAKMSFSLRDNRIRVPRTFEVTLLYFHFLVKCV